MDGDRRVTSDDKKPRGYKDLLVWQKGMDLAREIYKLTQTFPAEEKFGLASQMRRAGLRRRLDEDKT
ncbi:MAG TPA: four helix bundle protein [Terriglobia bacterium]|nr:four helix bundle protein [Terriglobia bacterium]